MEPQHRTYTAFAGTRLLGIGPLEQVVLLIKDRADQGETERLAFFDNETGQVLDLDLRGTPAETLARLAEHPALAPVAEEKVEKRSGPGRPKLGVVSREVSLLPRHWAWLGEQRGGASVTLRKLVDDARKRSEGRDRARKAKEAAHRFMWELAGNLPQFEEASRAFYANDTAAFGRLVTAWPEDIRRHLEWLVERAADLEREAEAETELASKAAQ